MKREKRLKWEPTEGIPPTVWLINLKCEPSLLILGVQDEKDESAPILTIGFHDFLTFRTIDEGDLLKRSYDDDDESLINIKREKGYLYAWSLFTVENSHYLEWFRKQSVGVNQDTDIVHYLIFTPNDVVEVLVLSDSSPTAMWN